MSLLKNAMEKISGFFSRRFKLEETEDEEDKLFTRHKVFAFTFAMLFSVALWFIVNMGRDYNMTMMLPIEITNLPEDIALSSEVPDNAAVSVSGEGWSLFNLYINPPRVTLNVDAQQVNMFEQVRQQISSMSDVSVMQVDPMFLEIETEMRVSKKVPVESEVEINTGNQFGVLGPAQITPDSVTVTGPASRVENVLSWKTEDTAVNDVNSDLEMTVDLQVPGPGITIIPSTVTLQADIAEFTEAEVRIPVRSRGLPSGRAVTFSPSSIVVKYDVPLEHYNDVQSIRPFVAFVDFERLQQDTTGLITPELEKVTDEYDVRLRSFQPTRVSYFNIVPE
ncbi:MAG TPA: YbbR-like domain-containing protein [Balneolaceae bacterium]|nr:YbbR-like domain-containing protein [Balneolaceae bacterium]